MECSTHCAEADEFFDEQTAREELRDYRRDGFSKKSGRLLVEGLESLDLEGKSLLDVGGGIGAIPFELFDEGIARSTLVEASAPYLEVAENEARRRGLDDRMEFGHGDFVEMAPDLPVHDVVTLDRVICCYPVLDELVVSSADRASRWYGVVYPKPNAFSKLIGTIADVYCWARGSDFGLYVHDDVDDTIRAQGFAPFYDVSTFLWRVTLYEREEPRDSPE